MPTAALRTVKLPSGEPIPALGLGTWRFAEDPRLRDQEIEAIRTGLDLGMSLIDTAEMYADGAAEELVGEAIDGRREGVFLVSKVLPQHATARGTIAACEASLARLRTDVVDLYLLHWRGPVPLAETLEAFAELVEAGRIRRWGVSNLDVEDMAELVELPGGEAVQTDQVLYNLNRRGTELDLLPWCRERGIPIMAYSPLELGRLAHEPALTGIATSHGVTPAQAALAWVLAQEGVVAIPRSHDPRHVREDREALDLRLAPDELADLDRAFPPPPEPVPLEMH
ncbi:aldo/keto reductase, diketogulonate reductase [Frankia torreyi]|uniref:Aldo/keto reductase, diketogulonate reductase n=1 Tax=Frankia torreyi TaxID=1856 RepID=A0A0D8BJ33_9ACTN|nr:MULTISPECIES: aldo/keto reductase [Frankia]KJE23407.1 aldo/keto reductase, diketogulonate reductase [Frankia torreyi]KQM05446.1 aldo/keto reductase, diketogulonate reductase [Frankia sp. CpI1-P]